VLRDRAVALPPLNRFLAGRLVDGTRAAKLLEAFRGAPPADRRAVEDLLLRVSEMVCELPWIEEMDLNPVMVDADGAVAVDARIVLSPRNPSARPYAHMAIHPYPTKLVTELVLPAGEAVTIRPIRPEDATLERDFVNGLSQRSRYLRFLYNMGDIPPQQLSRFTQIDYDREMALIAVIREQGRERQVGVARYAAIGDSGECDFAIVVADDWQGRHLAGPLLGQLVDTARDRRFATMSGIVLRDNRRMLAFVRSLGFETEADPEEPDLIRARLEL
jgi:acetyltransferase